MTVRVGRSSDVQAAQTHLRSLLCDYERGRVTDTDLMRVLHRDGSAWHLGRHYSQLAATMQALGKVEE